jgi:signal transduction histidine kinase
VRRPRFRTRLFLILSLFAVLPSLVLTLVWVGTASRALPLVSGSAAWERVATTGNRALEIGRTSARSAADRQALDQHELELSTSLEQARRFRYLAARAVPAVLVLAFLQLVILTVLASRVAGHLSRQLSRPLDEVVGWTELIARGQPLPEGPPRRGAPEFEVLRRRMRKLAREIEQGRVRAVEAERLSAFRETARQVAHEIKNPLTPIRFAVARLRREAPPELAETVEVLAVESSRLDRMAKSFAQFGRLPEGPASDVDVAELVRHAARSAVPDHLHLALDLGDALPMVHGHHDALARALTNVLLNAVEACGDAGSVTVRARAAALSGREAVEIAVRDTGCGIPDDRLARIWEPYVTHKAGGTGLGLAIARQTVLAHGGTVEAESRVGEGTEIRFVLPVAPSSELRVAESA